MIENETWQQNLTGIRYGSTSLGDIDNDNNLDLILTGCLTDGGKRCEKGAIVKVYINNGTSLIESSTWQQNLTGVGWSSTSFGDIDNDGDLDLALTGCTNASDFGSSCNGNLIIKIYINNGTSLIESFQWQNNLTATFDGHIAFGDINNDGKLDLLQIGRTTSSKVSKVYINNGTTLIESTQWQSNLTGLDDASLSFADVDNDGDLDLALTGEDSSSTKKTKIYINNGTSFIENQIWQQSLTQLSESSSIFGDIDNDGDLDYIIMGCCDELDVFENNGSSFTVKQRDITYGDPNLAGIFAGSLVFGDYDNDGYLDFAGIGRENGRSKVYWNNISKNNNFSYDSTTSSRIEEGNFTEGNLVWGDLNNDASLDIIVTGVEEGVLKSLVLINNASLTKNNTKPNASISGFSSSYSDGILNLSWGNGSDSETNTSGLYYNLMIGNSSDNHTIVSGVFGGSSGGGNGGGPSAGYFGNMIQRKNIELDVQLEANETYNWYVQTIDTGLAKSNWSAVQNFTTGLDVTKPNVTLKNPSPNASLHTINPVFVFNATVTDTNLTNVSLYADFNGTMIANETNSSGLNGTYIFNKTLETDGNYNWYIYACDGDSNCQTSGTRSFYLDRAYPIVNSISPSNGYTSSSASITFSYNVTDTDIANCSLIISGSIANTSSSIVENTIQTFTKTMSNGNYTWRIDCEDYVGYTNSSLTRTLTVNVVSGNGGGGSSAVESFWTQTYVINDEEFKQGYTKELIEKERLKISISNEIHYVGIVNLTNTTVIINITSNPIQVMLDIGEEAKVDISDNGFYDLFVRLNSIVNNKANLTIQSIYEEIPEGEGAVTTSGEEEIEEEEKRRWWLWVIVGIVVIVILFYLKNHLWKREFKNRRKKWLK